MRLRLAIVFAVLVAAVLVAWLAGAFDGDDGGPTESRARTPAESPPDAEILARRYAPLVWVHGGEEFGPASADDFVAASTLMWSRFGPDRRLAASGAVEPERLGAGCEEAEGGCYREGDFLAIDLTRPHHESPDRPGRLSGRDGFYLDPPDSARRGELGEDPDAPVFYEARVTESGGTRITYWFFYGFSRPFKPFLGGNLASLVSHEGDWENVDVVLDPDDEPSGVFFFGHGRPHRTPWAEVCKLLDGREDCDSAAAGRPIVFSARLSHASYPTADERQDAGSRVCTKLLGRPICSYDLRSRGFRWDPLDGPGDGLLDVRTLPWYGFGGAWGHAGRLADTTGPLGPSVYKLPAEPDPGELTQPR